MAKQQRGTKKKTTVTKSKVTVAQAWYRRPRFYIFVLLFAATGIAALVFTQAATTDNCAQAKSPTGSTLQICVDQPTQTTVNSTALYTGAKGTYRLTSATLSLYACTRDTAACSAASTSNKITKPNLFVPSKAKVTAPSISYDATKTYKACISFVDSTGWQQQALCTALADFAPATVAPTSSSTTTAPTTPTAPTCGTTSVTKKDGSAWQCTFNEDFNGTSYDRTKWVSQLTATSGFTSGTAPGRTCFVDNPNTIAISGGYLNLSVRKTPQPFTCAPASKGAFTTSYESGQLMTYKLFSQKFGRFEVRAKLPAERTKGLQETFWLWPDDSLKYGAWPASGEIDFGEFYSQYADYNVPYIHYNYKSYDSNTNTNIVTLLNKTYNHNYDNCKINFGEFNTYTAVWQSGYIELDVNGKPCVVDNYISTAGQPPAPFDQPFFLTLTQALGVTGNVFDEANPPKLPATTQVDYVRIWK